MPELDVVEVGDWRAIDSLKGEWNRLLADGPADVPFLRFEWLSLWWKHFGSGRRLAVILARRGGRLVAALPLMEARVSLPGLDLAALRSTTNGHSFRFNALCARDEPQALAAIWSFLRSRERAWQVMILEEVPEDASLLGPLLDSARRDGCPVGAWWSADVPYLPTVGTWEAYAAGLSRNMRANLRKKSRRLREHGDVAYRCVSSPGEVSEALRSSLWLEGSGWKEAAGSSISSDPGLTQFYSEWAETAAANGWLRLSTLEVDGRPVAFDFSTVYGGRYFDLKMGYDPTWGRHSVGQLLKAEILRRCFETDTLEYDFLGPSMRAKDDWAPRKRAHHWHYIYGNTPWGHALHWMKFKITPAVKRLLRS